MPLPERGSLAETSLPRVLVELQRCRFDGALELTRERVSKRFVLSDGSPVCSESSLPSDSLTAQLADAGKLAGAERARVESRSRESGAPEARTLLELGLLDTRGVFAALQEQTRLRLLDCFSWPDGTFALDAQERAPADAAALKVDLLPLVREGIAARWSLERVLEDLAPRMSDYPQLSDRLPQLTERLRVDPEAAGFLEMLDGHHTLWQALEAASGPQAIATAWLLDAVQALRYADGAEVAESATPEIELVVMGEQRRDRTRVKTRGGPAPDTAPSAGAEALRKDVEQIFGQLDELDYYQLLGLEPKDDANAVKRAYLQAAKTYHPDVLARSGLEPEARGQANRIFATIGKAYATLSDPSSRQEYDCTLGGDAASIDAERLANAETLFRKGEVLLRLGNFAGALEFLGPAVDLWSEEADYQNALGWALYKKLPSEPEQARIHLAHAAELSPSDSVVLFRLSVVLRALGAGEASEEMLSQAKQLDPKLA